MAIVIRYMCCLVFISRSSDLIQYGGIVTKANRRRVTRRLNAQTRRGSALELLQGLFYCTVECRRELQFSSDGQNTFKKYFKNTE